jgi:hypothetical protein
MSREITTEHHFEQISLHFILKVLDEHLSFFARQRATQEIVGCIIAGDFYLSRLHQKPYTGFDAFTDLLKKLDDMFVRDLGEELKPNMVLDISIQATTESNR